MTSCHHSFLSLRVFLIAIFYSKSLPRGWSLATQLVFKKVRERCGFQQCRIWVVGAAPVQTAVHEYFMSINIPLMELYGLSESSGCHTVNLRHNHIGWRVGSCGKPIKGVDLKIVDPDDNRERNEGEEGEVSNLRVDHVAVMGSESHDMSMSTCNCEMTH